MEETHEKIIYRIAEITVFRQPYSMKHVLEALMKDGEEDGIDLTGKDSGFHTF